MCNCDVGEMCPTFMLERKLRLHTRVDLSKVLVDKKWKRTLAC